MTATGVARTATTTVTNAGRRAGLDGLRGVALLGMLAWHAEIGWVRGGFARMTIFFALSGYLATRSYLRMTARQPSGTGWLWALRRYGVRRVRRLLPVTALGLLAGIAVTMAVGTTDMRASLRGDVLSVVGYVSNWRFLLADRSYGALFERPSAFQHYWSLSLEEQCLLVLPAVLAVALAVGGRRWAAGITAGIAAGLSMIPLLITHSPDAAYYGTHVRGAEFLAGVTLALVLDRSSGTVPAGWHRRVQVLGLGSLAGLAVVMVAVDRELPWLYQGGLGLFAFPAVAVIAAASQDRGPVSRLLGVSPLATIGRAAFPIYVLHWPLFVLVRHTAVPISGALLVTAELAAAIAIGLVVHHRFERPLLPVDDGDRPRLGDARVIGGALAGLTVLVAMVVIAPSPQRAYDFAASERKANTARLRVAGDTRPAVAFFGGSTAVSLGSVAFDWVDQRQPTFRVEPGMSQLGCGVVTEGRRVARRNDGAVLPLRPDDYCYNWQRKWADAADAGNIEIAVMFGGVWETTDWLLDGHNDPTDLTDPDFEAMVHAKLHEAAGVLTANGRRALMATTPIVGQGANGKVHEERGLKADHPDRVSVYNRLVRSVAAEYDQIDVLEYGDYIEALDQETSAEWIPDGVHPTSDASLIIWDELIGPILLELTEAPIEEALTVPGPTAGPDA
jgi:peptidoglycan/LPS O-acetylase OafA/YrhL